MGEDNNEKQVLVSAALKIQKISRGYLARKEFKVLQEQEYTFLGNILFAYISQGKE
jgi:hypothetical protein